jgi:hypothetical protein
MVSRATPSEVAIRDDRDHRRLGEDISGGAADRQQIQDQWWMMVRGRYTD